MSHNTNRHRSRIVAYYRVSTNKQGVSGLGLEAQRAAVQGYAEQHGLTIAAEFTEVQSGTARKKRPQFAAALEATRQHRASLVVAKLDRLGRSVATISALMESGVPFIVIDTPSADRFTLHILAAVAEQEAQLISERTRAALMAYKARGGKLGTPANLTPEARKANNQRQVEEARTRNRQATALALSLRAQGHSFQAIADQLQRDQFATAQGGRWTSTAIRRLLIRNESQQCVTHYQKAV